MTFDDLDNSRVQTHTEYKTLDPVWQRVKIVYNPITFSDWLVQVFLLPVPDVNSSLYLSVYDEDKNHKTEFLGEFSIFNWHFQKGGIFSFSGKLSILLLSMKNNEKRWFALKDKTLRTRAKGTFPQIQLEFELFWNPLQATYVTLNPRKEQHFKPVDKFKRQVFVNNVMRIKEVILAILDFVGFIKSCLEWEGQGITFILDDLSFHLISNYFLFS